ncbi:MAG: adenylyl-sulfate kinase [Candidatus Aminicenantes bacterium]|nr:adenylyl-sulfate kinase [Candidatus Aminicenantes bacterium]
MAEKKRGSRIQEGFTVWITGLPFCGKKETGRILAERLNMLGYKTAVLIGGEIRRSYEDQLGFSKKETQKNIRRIAFECKLLTDNGVIAIAATISPYRDLRDEARRLIKRYMEVYLKCPMDILRERDEKGLFRKAEQGTLKNVAGVTIPYEESEDADIVIETDKVKPFAAVNKILNKLKELDFLQEADHSVLLEQEEKDILKILRETWFK